TSKRDWSSDVCSSDLTRTRIALLDQFELERNDRLQLRVLPAVGALKIAEPFLRLVPVTEPALDLTAQQRRVGKLPVIRLQLRHQIGRASWRESVESQS